MSPEQAKGSLDIDHRTDIYSLGCVMYDMLSGEAPFIGTNAIETITKHLFDQPREFSPRLKIPAGLRSVVFKCLEKDPKDRYQSVQELSQDLNKLARGVSVKTGPLLRDREAQKKKLTTVVGFLVGFAVMYIVSIGAQELFKPTLKETTLKVTKSRAPVTVKAKTQIKNKVRAN
jgi:serine/threonine protein kinase